MLSDEARKDGGLTDEEVARSLEIASATVERIRRRCVEEGIEAALGRKEQQRRRPKKLDGAAEAHLIALACGEPPEGRARWTLRLLLDRLVECEIVESKVMPVPGPCIGDQLVSPPQRSRREVSS